MQQQFDQLANFTFYYYFFGKVQEDFLNQQPDSNQIVLQRHSKASQPNIQQ